MNKGFWMEKSSAHVDDGDATLSNTARIWPKRSHQWFVDASESELFSNKKQVLPTVSSKLNSGMSYAGVPPWENSSSPQTVPNQFMDRLFGSESTTSTHFAERNISSLGADNLNGRRKDTDNQFVEGVPVGLSMTHDIVDAETRVSYAGVKKVKVNQVKDCDNGMNVPRDHGSNNSDLTTGQAFDMENETSFISMGQTYNKDHDGMMLMGQTYNTSDFHIRSSVQNYGAGDENTVSIGDTFSKGDTNIMSLGGFPDEQDIIPVRRPVSNFDQFYHQSSVTSETASEKAFEASNANTILNTHVAKPKTESVSRNKPECKTSRKEAPISFPSNVRSLLSTGMLDGVPVKYVSLARQELRGTIKGSGYLCGCQLCNFSKVLNAYEFERHADSKTKHPNNHIYFENGKTIYQVVQELRSTPESLLFDAIQTVCGAPINQKSFRIWKDSFQAATRELQRIYGKEEMNS